MNEEQFRERVQQLGFGDLQVKDYAPNRDGPLHAHEFAVMLLILEGQFALGFENGQTEYRPGELCELAATVMHTERAGPEGAKVLLAKRMMDASTTAAV